MNTSSLHHLRRSVRKAQQGASLLFALMALVIMSLGAMALTRSVDSGSLIMGNLSFKQDTIVTASAGTEQAIAWLQNNINNPILNADQPASGYYASSLDKLDPTGTKTTAANKRPVVNWDGNCLGLSSLAYEHCDITPFQGTAVNGNRIRWVITRLCDSVGPASGANLCLRPSSGGGSSGMERGELTAGGRISGGANSPYYRVVVRVEGPRSTASYTETLIHF